jgi:hypothetical protein
VGGIRRELKTAVSVRHKRYGPVLCGNDDDSSSGGVGVIVGLSVGLPVAIGLGVVAIRACVTGESKVTVAAAG